MDSLIKRFCLFTRPIHSELGLIAEYDITIKVLLLQLLDVKKRANSLVSYSTRGICDSRYNPCVRDKGAEDHIAGHFRVNAISKQQRRWNNDDKRWWTGRKFGEMKFYVYRWYRVTNILGNISTE